MSNKNKTNEKNNSIMRKQGQLLRLVSSSQIHRSITGKLKPAIRYTRLRFFWLRFLNLYYFFVSYVCQNIKILQKKILIGPLLGEVWFFRVVLRLCGIKKIFELGQKNILFFFIYEPFIWANTSFSEIRSINSARDGLMCWSWTKISNFIPLSLRLSGTEFSLISD